MEVSQKEQNRQKWRSSTKRGRGRGGGVRGPTAARQSLGPELESNYDRYVASDDEGEGEDEEGLPVRQSQGADLQQLLAESEQFYAQAHFRYRSFIEAIDTEPPPVDVAAFEQELTIDPGPLIEALAQLPLTELFNLNVPLEFLQDPACLAPITARSQQTMVIPSQQPEVQPQAQIQQQQHQQPPQQQPPPPLVQQPGSQQMQGAAAPAAVAAAVAQRASHSAPSAAAAAGLAADGDDDDDLLDLLLSGGASVPVPKSTASARQSLLSNTTISTSTGTGISYSAPQPEATMVKPSQQLAGACPAETGASRQQLQAPHAGPAVLQQATPAAASAGFDAELDELLGLAMPLSAAAAAATTQSSKPQATKAGAGPGPAPNSSKKQSLEDWLDGL